MSSLRSDFIKVAGANVLLLLASTLNNFVLPIILSIGDYANYKTYILYASFAGFFHFGYVDGINIKYGGKDSTELDTKTFWSEHNFFLLSQLLISFILLIPAYITGSLVLALFAITIIPLNMQSFFLFFTQAVGQFSIYAKSVIVVPLLMSVSTCVVFATHISSNYVPFCIINIICYLVSWFLLEWRVVRVYGYSYKLNFKKNRLNHIGIVKSGVFIMMGTIVFSFFSTIGRWFIKWNMNDESFAVYSMAASLLGFVLIFVNAVNKVFYPYLCRNNENRESHKLLVNVLLLLATISLPFYFILKYFIELFLPNYLVSIELVKILLLTLPSVVIIQSYYINLYKARRLEKLYLRDGLLYTCFAVIVNLAAVYIFNDLRYIAAAAVICSYFWFFVPNRKIFVFENRYLYILYLTSISLIYLLSGYIFNHFILSFIVSLVGIVAVNIIFYKRTIIKILFRR